MTTTTTTPTPSTPSTQQSYPSVDMSKVKAFLKKKEKTTFQDEDRSGVKITVSVADGAPLQSEMVSSQDRMRTFISNALHWRDIEYETINGALGLEINAAMPPLVVYNAIAGRLREMSEIEKASIPAWVWTHFEELQKVISGADIKLPKKKKAPRTNILPIQLVKLNPDTIAIHQVGGQLPLLKRILDANYLWNDWRCRWPCETRDSISGETDEDGVRVKKNSLVIKCDQFKLWKDADDLRKIFASFDKPIEGHIITPIPPTWKKKQED